MSEYLFHILIHIHSVNKAFFASFFMDELRLLTRYNIYYELITIVVEIYYLCFVKKRVEFPSQPPLNSFKRISYNFDMEFLIKKNIIECVILIVLNICWCGKRLVT